jgi:hypothetical protein
MQIRFLAMALFSLTCIAQECIAQEDEFYYPPAIHECLKRTHSAAGKLILLKDRNPLYLRGDFRGVGVNDYAITVGIPAGGRAGVVICEANGKATLLGLSDTHPFSDMPRDGFVAPFWDVISKKEVRSMRQYRANVPNPVPNPRGESIAMIWEDGIALIYWDGKQFRWAG